MALHFRRIARLSYPITCAAFVLLLIATAAQAQDQGLEYTFSKEAPEQTATFLAVNPYTKVSGSMTITFSGVFHATRLNEPNRAGMLRITGDQLGTFTFVPDDASQPTISGKFQFNLVGKTQAHTDTIDFDFRMDGTGPDGSKTTFIQRERAFVNEGGLDISFGKTKRLVVAQETQAAGNQ
jgi:hypothetical protein